MNWIIRLCAINRNKDDSVETSHPTSGKVGLFFDKWCPGLCTKIPITALFVLFCVQCQGLASVSYSIV